MTATVTSAESEMVDAATPLAPRVELPVQRELRLPYGPVATLAEISGDEPTGLAVSTFPDAADGIC